MKLGEAAQISIGVPDLTTALNFYVELGFQPLAQGETPWPWAQLTDGQNLMLLNADGSQYVGLNYFMSDLAGKVAALEKKGIQFSQKRTFEEKLIMAVFSDADGLMVGLIQQDASVMVRPKGEPLTKLGKFGEFSLKVKDFGAAQTFWQLLGFYTMHISEEPYPWGIFSDGLIILGLHQAVEDDELIFTGPTMTYFAGNMAARIRNLKASGLPFAQAWPDESGNIPNAVLQAPAGERIFLFSGEV